MARLADYFIVVGYDHEKTGRCGRAQGSAVPGLFPPPLAPARPRPPSRLRSGAAGGGDSSRAAPLEGAASPRGALRSDGAREGSAPLRGAERPGRAEGPYPGPGFCRREGGRGAAHLAEPRVKARLAASARRRLRRLLRESAERAGRPRGAAGPRPAEPEERACQAPCGAAALTAANPGLLCAERYHACTRSLRGTLRAGRAFRHVLLGRAAYQ